MQLMTWTDERIEERFDGIDRRFDEVNRRIDHQTVEVNKRLDGVEVQVAEVRQSIAALHLTLNRASFGVIASLVGVIIAILLKGG
jgi:hypothetical protein